MHMQMISDNIFLVFKFVLVYFQHTFYCLFIAAVNHTSLVRLIIYLMTMLSCDMIISKKTGLLLLKNFFQTYKTLSDRIMSRQIRH